MVDYLKLLIFTILLMIPIYTINGCATYFGLDMLVINISSLSFIYFITFFCSKDDEGAKILFLFVFGFLIIIVLIVIAFPESSKNFLFFEKPFVPSILDITPITSMSFSFIRLIISYSLFSELEKAMEGIMDLNEIDDINGLKRPEIYLVSNYIAQAINIVLYTLLLVLAESGLLGKLIHHFELDCYADNDIKTVPVIPGQNNIINENDNNTQNSGNIINDDISNQTNDDINYPLINSQNTPVNNIIENNQYIINTNQIQYNQQPIQYNQIQNYSPIQQDLNINNYNPGNFTVNPLFNPYVQSEIRKVNNQENLTTRIINVTKTFYPCCACCRKGKVRAINHLHLGLEPNEKFGLLGFNGSGKTTTFRAITNEIATDFGTINLFGYDTKKQFNYIRTIVGYCPQINPLFDFMKVREIISFYSKLKSSFEDPEMVAAKFGLSKYLDTYTVNLSGGNKRKLTFAIAMMNKPTLLLLDEPSTGVDPESRRIMWKNINELSNSGHKYNMILTTHAMEEAEILCDTVSWFRAGNFITLGNPEELKLKYCAGYKLHIKFDLNKINYQIQGEGELAQAFNTINSLVSGFNMYSILLWEINLLNLI